MILSSVAYLRKLSFVLLLLHPVKRLNFSRKLPSLGIFDISLLNVIGKWKERERERDNN